MVMTPVGFAAARARGKKQDARWEPAFAISTGGRARGLLLYAKRAATPPEASHARIAAASLSRARCAASASPAPGASDARRATAATRLAGASGRDGGDARERAPASRCLACSARRAARLAPRSRRASDSSLADQPRRAAQSISLNISEANRRTLRDRRNRFRIALGSAAEVDRVRAMSYRLSTR